MIIVIDWLKDYVDIDLSPEELADLLTNSGLESDVILDGRALDIELTPNRPDCMSHLGVARDIAVLTGRTLSPPQFTLKENDQKAHDDVAIEIIDKKECPRYACRVVKNVKVSTSPQWIVERLEMGGIRSINNIVDVSNYVLLELGHPLHTFDLLQIAGAKIIVRLAKKGETITTLDGEEQKLTADHLLICDGEKPVALAGVMGGENSEVSDATTDVLIESAFFDPVTVRKGSKALGLSTEASKRFERGTDYEGLITALNRTASMLAEIAGGEISSGIVDAYPEQIEISPIRFRTNVASATAGINFEALFIEQTFEGLGISYTPTDDGYNCTPPTFRPDLEREIDLTEELVRVYGFSRIDSDLSYAGYLSDVTWDPGDYLDELRQFFVGLGFNEVSTNSLIHKREAGHFTASGAVELQNPISRDMAVLRTSLFPGLLKAVSHNLKRGENDLSLFEHGMIFAASSESKTGCEETEQLAGIICGNQIPRQWKRGEESADFYTVKGIADAVARFLSIKDYSVSASNSRQLFNPGQVLINGAGEYLVEFGLFSADALAYYDIEVPLFGFRLSLERIREKMSKNIIHQPPPKHPGILRDLSFLLQHKHPVGEIEKVIRENGTDLLTRLSLYDLYEGDQIEKDQKSVTFSLFFRDDKRTLKDEEVDDIVAGIISETSKRFSAKLR
ncbi:MAG: phenylalanine--tRNA ligase subunit beta [Candidatus Marinimicrobia bacterium]|jgi:phenylalanyl-tRNA synthetase beta chain|nr:phenylalanine--tRNA ligase subunit beta [Candidatus Neomarinimicrobiota bacterium]|tara:strand:- start:1471 stop:3507 length:2037 start_codon:yes stop_codon:yes gene_type:complete